MEHDNVNIVDACLHLHPKTFCSFHGLYDNQTSLSVFPHSSSSIPSLCVSSSLTYCSPLYQSLHLGHFTVNCML